MTTIQPFQVTRWSRVMAAGAGDRPAMEDLCRDYWLPLYAFVRRKGFPAAEAEDLVQGFFVHLLEREAVAVADARRGRFRTFLLAALTNYLADEHARMMAAKRGGGKIVPLPGDSAHIWESEPLSVASPEAEFDRRWALEVLDGTRRDLEDHYASSGRAALFAALAPAVYGGTPDQDALTALGLSPGAVKVARHRLRSHWRDHLRQRVADTLGPGEVVEHELADLLAAVRGTRV
jgi:DNA-directed RNA polymerase specialized sigma24 family protein